MLLVVAPLFVLSSSASRPFIYLARAAIAATLLLSWLWREEPGTGPATAEAGSGSFLPVPSLCVLGILLAGLVGADLSASGTWTGIVQLLLLERLVAGHRAIALDDRMRGAVAASLAGLLLACACATLLKTAEIEIGDATPGPFNNPNALGMTAVAIALFAFVLGISARGSGLGRWMAGVFLASAGLVFGSGSRTGVVALAVFLLVYAAGRSSRWGQWSMRGASWGAFLAIPTIIVGYGVYLVESLTDEFDFAGKQLLSGRHVIWPSVLARAAESPWFGYGLGRSPGDDLPGHYEGLSAHNGFLQVLYQGGVLGLASYLALLFFLFRRALSLPSQGGRAASVAVLCAAICCESFEVILTQNHFGIGLVLWVLITTTVRGDGASMPVPDPGSSREA